MVTFETLHPVLSAFRCVFNRSLLTQCEENSSTTVGLLGEEEGLEEGTGSLLHDT